MTTLGVEQYRELLYTALPVATDSDTTDPDVRTLFTPIAHRRALDPDVTVVKGGRGVGKTVWFKALQDDQLRSITAQHYQLNRLNDVVPLAGYGTEIQPDKYPSQRTLSMLAGKKFDAKDIWMTVVLTALGADGFVEQGSWEDRVNWLLANPEGSERGLAEADIAARAAGVTKLFLFDGLDRLHSRRAVNDALVHGILRVALDLRTQTRHLRSKIFIRPDMFDGLNLNFPDASKLVANSADLTWSAESLYGLLFHRLGNADSPFAEAFASATGDWHQVAGRRTPPAQVVADSTRQRTVFGTLAGAYMGKDHRKGITYTWLPNHLTDGIGQVSPRSFLAALRKAAEITQQSHAGHEYALHWEGIRRGVQEASGIRVAEVREDIPWVATAITPLKGMQVPIEEDDVIARWMEVNLELQLQRASDDGSVQGTTEEHFVATGPLTVKPTGLIAELTQLGVMTRRANGKIDLPDVYRIAFDLGRKGGVPRIR